MARELELLENPPSSSASSPTTEGQTTTQIGANAVEHLLATPDTDVTNPSAKGAGEKGAVEFLTSQMGGHEQALDAGLAAVKVDEAAFRAARARARGL